MSNKFERGAMEERGSALWGTGSRGGDRSSVLWGKGGRGILVSCVAVFALAAPIAASAGNGKGKGASSAATTAVTAAVSAVSTVTNPVPSGTNANTPDGKSWIAPGLLNGSPNDRVDVIVTSSGGTSSAVGAMKWLSKSAGNDVDPNAYTPLNLVGGIEASVPVKWLKKLASVPGLMITPNALVQVSGVKTTLASSQLWPYASGNSDLWAGDQFLYAGKTPAIAVVDSGVQQRSDFGTRIIASVNLSTLPNNTSMDDQRGHGTFVAGIAAGAAPDLAGAAPGAPIVSIKVMDANGQAKTSDVITACQWILDHKDQYNIKVANFSLHSSYATNFYRDPLDQAVERLWFAGVTVVAAAGNYGTSTSTPSGVTFSPGNDPFVITVGALDLGATASAKDDTAAPFSAWGYTEDGFFKPELSAPGRYMVGPVPAGSSLTVAKASNMVGTDRIQLSGTSFSAPVVSGTVADMLARHPSWTPDQVKGALMRTTRHLTVGNPKAAGLGELTATRAAISKITPNPNAGLDRFVTSVPGGSGSTFNAMSWANAAKSDMSWNSMSWADQSWSDMSWADQSWSDMSWADMSWADQSWSDMSWADMSWADVSSEDAAEGDGLSGSAGYTATPDQVAAAASDSDQVVVDPGLVDTTTTATTAPVADPTAAAATDPTATASSTPVPVPAALLP
jgi:serine protease AprX